jgi:hypothetical protein
MAAAGKLNLARVAAAPTLSASHVTPADEYRARLDDRRTAHARLLALDRRISHARLALFGAALLVALLAFGAGVVSAWWLAPLVIAFGWLMKRHDRVIGLRDAAARSVAFYERGLARINDRWIGGGEPGDRFRDDDHLYANDLDLFGAGSLFELLSIARTRAGEETLASWLKMPSGPDVIRQRQQAIAEMTPRLDLREALALAGTEVRAGVQPTLLVEWASAPPVLGGRWSWTIAALLTLCVIGSALYSAAVGRPEPLILILFAQGVLSLRWRRRVEHVLHAADRAARDLDILAHVLERLEREAFQASRLAALRAALDRNSVTASGAIRRMHAFAEMHDWQHNQFFAIFGALLLWGTHLAHAIERWRARHGPEIAGWLAIVGEFEALSSLAAFRYEHPDDTFAEIVDGGEAVYEGTALGHPLLPAARLVRNDVRLSGGVRLLVVSGSNMSGKSTLLRTVGINAVLALAGAPVRAARLRLTPLAVGATLRIQDSLQEGRSRFYAEITRIRRLADVAGGPAPLLFLLDELFHGTNSHDRLVGATGVLRSFVERGAVGLITTHDLALTQVVDDLAPHAANVHFEDTFEGGEITFDYRARPGPVTRSNAIALMRAVGLDVEDE